MLPYKAFLFDMNGTMIDDMHFHERACFNILTKDLHAPLTQEEVKLQMYGKNEELFDRVFGPDKFSATEMAEICLRKEQQYQQDFLPHLKLITGLDSFLQKAKSYDINLAICTAASPFNINYVLDNLQIRDLFPVIVSADDVKMSKPDPEVFLKAAMLCGISPEDCVVFEDAPKGVEAAKRAGMKAVAITTYHTSEELRNDNVVCTVKDYDDASLRKLLFGKF